MSHDTHCLIPALPMHVCPEPSSHRSPTCTTQAPVLHSEVPQDVLQTALYTDLDLLDRSAFPVLIVQRLWPVLYAGRLSSPTASSRHIAN